MRCTNLGSTRCSGVTMWRSRQSIRSCVVALLTVIVVGIAAAQSQPPAPSAGKVDKPPQNEPRRSKQAPQSDQRGTEKSPIAIKIIPAPKTEAEATQEKADRA